MRHVRQWFAIAALTVGAASPALAQQQTTGFWELGTDAAITLGLDDPKFLSVQVPGGLIRAGYFTSPTVSIEPVFSWLSIAQDNQEGFSSYTLGVGVLFHRSVSRAAQQIYLRPFLHINGGSGGGGSSLTLGGGLGVKRPMLGGRVAKRMEANVSYNDDSERLNLQGLLGLSIYTR